MSSSCHFAQFMSTAVLTAWETDVKAHKGVLSLAIAFGCVLGMVLQFIIVFDMYSSMHLLLKNRQFPLLPSILPQRGMLRRS